jgi:hypothetical protein
VVVVYFLGCGPESRGQSSAIFANWRRERRSASRLSAVGIQCAENVIYGGIVCVYGNVFAAKLGEPKPECSESSKHLLVVDNLVSMVARVWF